MKRFSKSTTVSVIALSAAVAMPTAAGAGCVLSVGSTAGNVCIGAGALASNTTATENTATGYKGLYKNTTGYNNVASGSFALYSNTTGQGNVAVGSRGLLDNTTGAGNTAAGFRALENNVAGYYNIALGFYAGSFLTGSDNIAIGNRGVAGESGTIRIGAQGNQKKTFIAGISEVALSGGQAVVVNSSGQLGVAPAIPGTSNLALGGSALVSNTTGSFNTAAGVAALAANTTGANNTASGASALTANATGNNNTATGANALIANTGGSGNTAAGLNALRANTVGNQNVATGVNALFANKNGNQNVAVGYEAAKLQTTGSANTAIGYQAGMNWTTGSNNIAIANLGVAAETKTIRIGVQGVQTRSFVAGIRGVNVTGGQAVVVDANGQLGVVSSSRRYKQDIRPMGDASSALLQLHPVTFHYRQAAPDGSNPLQYGLVAEEVAQVMPELAIYNAEGQPESVAYQVLPSLLLNEYQKQAEELTLTRSELAAVKAEMAQMKVLLQQLATTSSSNTRLAIAH